MDRTGPKQLVRNYLHSKERQIPHRNTYKNFTIWSQYNGHVVEPFETSYRS